MPGPVLAAGGILWRRASAAAEIEVLLVHRPRYDDWTFPKGKLHKGETLLTGAVREVSEETGISVVVGHRMSPVRYQTADGPKEVTYWTMQPAAGEFAPSDEVDSVCWVSLTRARTALSYDHDRRLADELVGQPPGVVRLILVRHAAAGSRKDFDGPDTRRPLVARGRRQARRLVPLLACFGPTRVLSAAPRRCVETVEPIAHSAGLVVGQAPMFGEDEFSEDPTSATERLLAELSSTGDVTVIASQGGVIPALISGLSLSQVRKPGSPVAAAKASAWALASAAGRLRADYYKPPKR